MIYVLGGGASLNYKVVGGTSTPTSPSENTIWVNTSTAITSHVFSAEQPSSPSAGMVWFNVGTSCPAPINVLKKNALMVYPSGCAQYVSGSWISKTAKTYQNGAWVDWATYIYSMGDLFEDVTGGWSGKTGNWYGGNNTTLPTITNSATGLRIYQNGGNNAWGVSTTKAIDISGYATLVMKVNVVSHRDNDGLAVWASTPKTVAASNIFSSTGTHEISLDISGVSGTYYVGLRGGTTNGSVFDVTILEARLER